MKAVGGEDGKNVEQKERGVCSNFEGSDNPAQAAGLRIRETPLQLLARAVLSPHRI